ncbi:MAG: type III-B CRISPR module-associated protein Cmr3 [Syntrophomonas sp.]|uniref:type III-B CRISPR module-associated protein Cmr3 n=1 Tax=Syntrophomonas sp. TaxID=2053627 RepID=UPI00260F4C54|nr:type III-B CRISPR module-associated protein Cmr3 [Syntrophomonas sp.]MDD2510966.1 type III-B CRISPR module-associated protein Cmr3 [Syntrophomonas sp.]MDD3879180.1 type III-B CRISPR module-associated protein Cmr3 [Syntrophomonas sp.]MDD4626010.1 type III-B CRISPR module-associated protein Cmr3 [Syntrophomonas sp.]
MWIEIEALDTLFFRDGKPFSMGQESWAEGKLFPLPSVLYGALRSAYLGQHPERFANLGELDDVTSNLTIRGIYYRLGGNLYLPQPADLVARKDRSTKNMRETGKPYEIRLLNCSEIETGVYAGASNLEMIPERLLMTGDEVDNRDYGLTSNVDINTYLQTGAKNIPLQSIDAAEHIVLEPKVGIGKDRISGSSADGKLYRVGMKRYDGLSMVVEIEGLELKPEGFLKLGGEGKGAYYRTLQIKDLTADMIATPEFNDDARYFKLYLSTPCAFAQGWLPEWINTGRCEGTYRFVNGEKEKALNLKLISAVMSRYMLAGGFDIKERRPKPARRVVPAGSVYYFKLRSGGDMNDVIQAFHGRAISELDKEPNRTSNHMLENYRQGFGISYVGVLNL